MYNVNRKASTTSSKALPPVWVKPKVNNNTGVKIPIPYTPIPSHPQGRPLSISQFEVSSGKNIFGRGLGLAAWSFLLTSSPM